MMASEAHIPIRYARMAGLRWRNAGKIGEAPLEEAGDAIMSNKANLRRRDGGDGDCGLAIPGGVGVECQTKPIFAPAGLRIRVGMENKANPRGQDCRVASLLAMTGAGVRPVVRNKANLPATEMRHGGAEDAEMNVKLLEKRG